MSIFVRTRRKNTLQTTKGLIILVHPNFLKTVIKFQPMKHNPEISPIPTGKIFLKLTVFGCFLLGFAYISLLILNNVLRALH